MLAQCLNGAIIILTGSWRGEGLSFCRSTPCNIATLGSEMWLDHPGLKSGGPS
jgi:hypothetical protein